MASLTIQHATKSFGGLEVLHGVDIQIADGEFVVLVGPSGCGKSTLLRLIAGLEDITQGEILIGDREVSHLHPKDRDIAMVFQSYALYPHMTVEENMGFSLRMRDVNLSERKDKVRASAEILGLTNLLGRYPRQLSGGQRQRVAMGRAIVRDPKVFLFDEPLSNLDAKLRVQMRSEIRELHKKLGTTIVYVTHDQIEAMTMADTIVVMRDGYVEQIGSPLDLYDRPANIFVGSFIGSPAMNMLEGRIGGDRQSFVSNRGTQIAFGAPVSPEADRKVILGIRPEDIGVSETGTPAMVRQVEPTGADLHVNLDLDGDGFTALFHERLPLEEGQNMGLKVLADQAHFFDPDSGKRIE
ncbi:ABC transporter ATP-binding protein [Tropicimonas sp. IMCC6043]|uniref:ABC transporter ATP-binding protein n=1 Tax=Tropicimonas sp. IMCC6043 TaxID=2510645 RepID=UPI00101CB94C|nr:sn-glycerol-3-phosphate ABC transporter ATP-binding protein UgpC [Tropicimonas sp. IMCC6043]RYH06029.1 sn-glycerol-3-phosphate ABC transporter ATP-binding protein UgpC [Tropicimonas sp. IMCC6043]